VTPMGFWSRFEKKETVHFERDQSGRVTDTYRNGKYEEPQPRMKPVRQLEQEYYAEKKKQRSQRPAMFSPLNRIDVVPVPYQRRAPRSPSFKPYRPSKNDRNPFGRMFDMGMPNAPRMKTPKTKYAVVGGKAYPIAGSSSKKKKKKKDNLLGFDMLGNNWGL